MAKIYYNAQAGIVGTEEQFRELCEIFNICGTDVDAHFESWKNGGLGEKGNLEEVNYFANDEYTFEQWGLDKGVIKVRVEENVDFEMIPYYGAECKYCGEDFEDGDEYLGTCLICDVEDGTDVVGLLEAYHEDCI